MSKETVLDNIQRLQGELQFRNKQDQAAQKVDQIQAKQDLKVASDATRRATDQSDKNKTLTETSNKIEKDREEAKVREENIQNRSQTSSELDKAKELLNQLQEETFGDNESDEFPIVDEILAMNNMLNQHPITGRYISGDYQPISNNYQFDSKTGKQLDFRNKQRQIIQGYRNKLFGAPFQLLDSVDARFSSVNDYVGYEFLRNFLIHTPIIHIYPGLPRYTGNDESIFDTITNFYRAVNQDISRNGGNHINPFQALYKFFTDSNFQKEYAATTGVVETNILKLFIKAKLQKRLFGITFKYEEYLRYVKLMCHGVAFLLKLTGEDSYIAKEYPNGTFVNTGIAEPKLSDDQIKKLSDKAINEYASDLLKQYSDRVNNSYNFQTFANINWGNYRMIEDSDTVAWDPDITFKKSINLLAGVKDNLSNIFKEGIGAFGDGLKMGWDTLTGMYGSAWDSLMTAGGKEGNYLDNLLNGVVDGYCNKISADANALWQRGKNISDQFREIGQSVFEANYDIASRVQSVEFMIQPCSANEGYQNEIGASKISQMAEQVNDAGAEVSFLTNSSAVNVLGKTMIDSAAGMTSSLAQALGSISAPFTGNFLSNLFSGAIGAVTGNRFIYPEIYKRSTTDKRHFDCSVRLSSPYGDIYNYYMNIVVPLCHIQGFTLPKLKTSNSVNSPYIVRAFIPGLMTCELGMITNLRITKNPSNNRVTINNFPLDVDVQFSIDSLYDHLAISPTSDGLSYINNETLKDYLCNEAGIYPTINRQLELNITCAELLKSQFNIVEQAKQMGMDFLLVVLGQM